MISAQGLTKYYGDKCAIHDISFEIDKGEIVGILGLNGAGKSTTLKILSCLLLPSAGTIRVNDLDVTISPHEVRKLVGFLPESPPLYNEMTVDGFLSFCAQLRGVDRDQTADKVAEVLRLTNTTDVRHQVIGTLSHGFRQRVGIAQAIVHNPSVLVLDEPIKGLDPVQIVEVREMIKGLRGRHTIIVSSHILSEISQTCDRILVIKDGEIVGQGTEEELTGGLAVGQRVHVVVRGERDKVLEALRSLDGVVACHEARREHPYRTRPSDGVVALEVVANNDLREAISRTLVEGGFGLLQLSPAEAELESVFIQLTGQAAHGRGGSNGGSGSDASPSAEGETESGAGQSEEAN